MLTEGPGYQGPQGVCAMKLFVKAVAGKLAATRACWVGADNDIIDAWFEAQPEDEVDGQPTNNDRRSAPHPGPVVWGSGPNS